jgi:hypothetical protein
MSLRTAALLLIIFATTFLSAQTQAPAVPPQTAREAFVEMLTGGDKGLMKHLTAEVQDLLNKPENRSANTLAMFSAMQQQAGSGMQIFPTGSTLLLINEPVQHKKYEVRVDSDDLSGDEDTLQLSIHSFEDGQEKPDELGYLASRITIAMKKQQNIWRLSNLGLGMEFPVGDPKFLRKMFFTGHDGKGAHTTSSAPTAQTELVIHSDKPMAFNPADIVTFLEFAERSYATQHPDIGFTCSLPDLTEAGKITGLDPQLASGTYMGYKWSVSGCEGKPAGSFQIIAEPIIQGRGGKAACVDATGNLRTMDDGRGSACLALGKVDHSADDDSGGMTGFKAGVHIDPEKPNSDKPKL